MKRKLFLAVDLGTSFIKAGIYDLNSTCLAVWSEAVKDERPAPGFFLQHGEDLYRAAVHCIAHCVAAIAENADQIEAMAFTGQMAGAIGVDEHWEDVTTWSCSLDSRYVPYANEQRSRLEREFYEISGTNAPVMCAKYAWFKDAFPKKHCRIAKYVMLNGYMIGRLSGTSVADATIDNSLIAWTGMADVQRGIWSETMIRELKIDPAHLPKIVNCNTVCGYLGEKQAALLGLRAGIPLVAGAGDKVSGCVGSNILNYGDKIFEAASYGAISILVPEVHLDTELRGYDVIGAANKSDYYVHKYIQGSGVTIDWFINTFAKDHDLTFAQAIAEMEEQAIAVPPGSENMMAIGLLGGSAIPFNGALRGCFMGHTWNHTKGHFYHSLLESFGYELALTLRSFNKNYPHLKGGPIKMIGGGAKSAVWGQILADITGDEFHVLSRKDSALWGCALLAASGVGAISDIRGKAAEYVLTEKVFHPNEHNLARYAPYIDLYKNACDAVSDLCAQIHMKTKTEEGNHESKG